MIKLTESIKKEYTPNSFIVKISHVCNLTCRDCYYYNSSHVIKKQYPNFMSLDTAQSLFRFAYQLTLTHKLKQVTFHWHGGEPMATPVHLFEQILQSQRQIFDNSDIKIKNVLQTNGTLFGEERLNFLKEYDIRSIGISIDGIGETNDTARVAKSRIGAFTRIQKNVSRLLEEGFKIGILTVVDGKTSLIPLINWLTEKGLKQGDWLPLKFCSPTSKEDYDSEEIRNTIIEACQYIRDKEINFNYRTLSAIRKQILGISSLCSIGDKRCFNYVTIMPDGSMHLCENFGAAGYPNDSLELNVNQATLTPESLKEAIVERMAEIDRLHDENIKCLTCEHEDVCGGGCMASRYQMGKFVENNHCDLLYNLCDIAETELQTLVDL